MSQLRKGPERVALEVPGRGTGDFPDEGCDGETASCAFRVSQLRAGPERVAVEVPGRGKETFRVRVATGKRHPSDSRLHAKSRSRDRRRPGIREAHSQAKTARPGAAGVLRGQSTPTI